MGNFRYYRSGNDFGTVEFDVEIPGGLYPVTTCVIDGNLFMRGQRIFPCGSGDDYRLSDSQMRTVRNLLDANSPQ